MVDKSRLFLSMALVASLVFTVSCVSKEVPVTETYYETEYQTEYKTETYTDTEDVVVRTTEGKTYFSPVANWQTGLYFEAEGSGTGITYYYGYEIEDNKHTRGEVKISISSMAEGHIGVYNLTGLNQIPPPPQLATSETDWRTGKARLTTQGAAWLNNLNAILTNSEFRLKFQPIGADKEDEISFDAKGISKFAILVNSWQKDALSSVKLVWSDDIIEQRTVTKERQVPYQVSIQVEKQRTIMKTQKVPFWEAMLTEETTSTTPAASRASQEPPASPATASGVGLPVPSSSLLYEDDFSDRKSGYVEQSTPQGESYYKDGEFHGVVKMWDWSSWQYRQNAGRFKDFIIEEDIRLVSGPRDSNYGLIFRCQDDDNFYRFQVSANGSYVIGARLNGKWADFQRWTMSEYVEKGYSTNHLKVVCKGSQIDVYVNGHRLTTVADDSFTDGYVGGIIYTPEPSAHVAFDNLKVYSPD